MARKTKADLVREVAELTAKVGDLTQKESSARVDRNAAKDLVAVLNKQVAKLEGALDEQRRLSERLMASAARRKK